VLALNDPPERRGGRRGQRPHPHLRAEPGEAVQVDPMKPTLKAPGTKRLKLQYGEPLSNFAFKFNLRRYNLAGLAGAYTRPLVGST